MNTTIRVATALASTFLAGALAGCSGAATPVATPHCDQPPVLTDGTRTVAILGQTGRGVDYYQQDLSTVLDDARVTQAHVLVNGVGDGTTAPNLLANVVVQGDGANNLERNQNLTCKESLVTGAVESAMATPASDGLDVFGSLLALQGNLEGTSGTSGADVVVFGSLLNTAGPVDLSDPAQLSNPAQALNTLATNRLIPNCEGWRMYAVGSSSADSTGDTGEDALLREFWRQYMERCGGQLVAWTAHLTDFPGDGVEITAADTDQIQIQTLNNEVLATLGGDVLFDTGSSDLRPEADASLGQLLDIARAADGTIAITGHTDVRGDAADNLRLSKARAESVATWLIDHGIASTRISTDGVGSSEAAYPATASAQDLQSDRRVVVAIEQK